MEATAGGNLPITVPLLMVGDTRLFSGGGYQAALLPLDILLPLISYLLTVSTLVLFPFDSKLISQRLRSQLTLGLVTL
jgi:hypothetical protein